MDEEDELNQKIKKTSTKNKDDLNLTTPT